MRHLKRTRKAIVLAFALFLGSCGGGGDSNGRDPGNNACSAIGLSPKIVNGTACGSIQSAPVVRVLLRVQDAIGKRFVFACTGTMISKRHVLSAAHCFSNNDTGAYRVIGAAVGIGELNALQIVEATQIYSHPQFSTNGGGLLFNDVAIMLLSRDVRNFSLPILAGSQPFPGEVASVFGYGQTVIGEDVAASAGDSSALISGEMIVDEVDSSHIFVKYEGKGSNVCFGDSGGPLVLDHQGVAGIAGVVSESTRQDCSAGDITAFTNITEEPVLSWILGVAPEAVVM